ncbi:ABC transporter ATP-binding protein [Paenibacillus sp. SYP-B4298]|uniref:ABC transporter ATP-binding protein n=1 Tax=Paenibacillus sp. SYP-B4298 TaxID=2996034 RepID=UPI0022DE6F6B|nr:ABC transporter ATP-binding protein [Paenibacillus sp. SYP-B4298]
MQTIIKTTGLTKQYGTHKAVDSLNLNVNKGQIYGFLGQNGAGKTTTIRMLLGLIRPTSGRMELFGERIDTGPGQLLKRIGSMIEFSGFYENLTARENLQIHARLLGIHKPEALQEALEIVSLHQETKKLVGSYSLGMKQRLGIARAIMHHPELLILDEPTNGLDPVGIKEMRGLIRTLAKERQMTILISSHILPEVEQLADRIGIVHQGRLLEEISMDELRTRNRHYMEFQVSDDNKAVLLLEQRLGITDYVARGGGILRIYSHLGQQAQLNRLFVEQGIDVSRIDVKGERLEDYFVRLIGGGTFG